MLEFKSVEKEMLWRFQRILCSWEQLGCLHASACWAKYARLVALRFRDSRGK
jgi:hypothetical protein